MPPKAAAYWSWRPPDRAEIDAFYLIGEVGDVVVAKWRVERHPHGVYHCDNEGRGGAKTRARRGVDSRTNRQTQAPTAIELAHHALIDSSMKGELGLGERCVGLENFRQLGIV